MWTLSPSKYRCDRWHREISCAEHAPCLPEGPQGIHSSESLNANEIVIEILRSAPFLSTAFPLPTVPVVLVRNVAAVLFLLWAGGCGGGLSKDRIDREVRPAGGAFHVHPGESIQKALDAASRSRVKRIVVHEGEYRPPAPRQALIWMHAVHDGITLVAEGEVVLRADNPEIASAASESFPAVVNHVVYFGDGITSRTVFRGFRITGANGFVTRDESVTIQPETGIERLKKKEFFYTDGGGIKIFGRSYPTIEEVDVVGNFARPCGGGVSIEHRGFNQEFVRFQSCIFRCNSSQLTGSGVDVLPGSAATFTNCLFLNNIGNVGEDNVSPEGRSYNHDHGSGALTVFRESRVRVERCTFSGNWNGVDDKGRRNVYRSCIFWQNNRDGGLSPKPRYELDILHTRGVQKCYVSGGIEDLRGSVDPSQNVLGAPDPEFDDAFFPHSPVYADVGYRPTGRMSLRRVPARLSECPTRQTD